MSRPSRPIRVAIALGITALGIAGYAYAETLNDQAQRDRHAIRAIPRTVAIERRTIVRLAKRNRRLRQQIDLVTEQLRDLRHTKAAIVQQARIEAAKSVRANAYAEAYADTFPIRITDSSPWYIVHVDTTGGYSSTSTSIEEGPEYVVKNGDLWEYADGAPSTEPDYTPSEVPSDGGGSSQCHPSYVGACLDPNSYDYDCLGGSGNGPDYTGRVSVVGPDVFGLDADGNGIGCE